MGDRRTEDRSAHPRAATFAAIAIFANSAKGHPALHLSRDLNVQYKTAFVLAHKIREEPGTEMDGLTASGDVHVDGAYSGRYVEPANWKDNRRDRRLLKNQNGKRRVVIVMREVDGRCPSSSGTRLTPSRSSSSA